MAKIPFSIDYRPQIESGEYKVENRDGDIVTILEWDIFIHGMAHMILIRYNEKYEFVNYNGRVNRTGQDCNLDLFIITPEPELTEFEDRVKQLMGCYPNATRENKGSLIYEVRKAAAELLELAKKELCESGEVADWYAKGKAEALKDLPRWKKSNGKEQFDERLVVLTTDNCLLCDDFAGEGEYYISFSD